MKVWIIITSTDFEDCTEVLDIKPSEEEAIKVINEYILNSNSEWEEVGAYYRDNCYVNGQRNIYTETIELDWL